MAARPPYGALNRVVAFHNRYSVNGISEEEDETTKNERLNEDESRLASDSIDKTKGRESKKNGNIEKAKRRQEIMRILTDKLMEDAKWCWSNSIFPILSDPPASIDFFRDFVHKNTPCILKNLGVCGWDKYWTWDDIVEESGRYDRQVRVNATPNGRGDAVVFMEDTKEYLFVKPEERMMSFGDFIEWVLDSSSTLDKSILYLSAQNDSLREEFGELVQSNFTPASLPFGDQVFGKKADAVNLWIGNESATSTMHRDVSYENLYCVLKGTKVFHLMPPCSAAFLGEKPRPNASYKSNQSSWEIVREEGETPWIALDVADFQENKVNKNCPPEEYDEFSTYYPQIRELIQRIEVKAGEVLYLPAGWFHRVTQSEPTIAVNYWYDRDFNANWALTEALDVLVEHASRN